MRPYHILAVLAVALILSYFYVSAKLVGRASNSSIPQSFEITKGEGVNAIATGLQKNGLISNRLWFEIYIWGKKKEGNIVEGTYTLEPNMTIPEIVDIITSGKSQKKDTNITIIEGWSNKQIGEYLAEQGIVSNDEFMAEANNLEKYRPNFLFLQDAPFKATLEGFLFPDTYSVIQGKTTAEQIVFKMLSNFDKKLTDTMRADIKNSKRSIYDIVTMGSVIEKEVSKENDRKIVSGIFWNRIKNKQPLQSCATISYILGVNKKQYTFDDTRIDSPYNTYLNKGLPIGPIGNPGLSALTAATYPQDSDFVYFLSDPATGETVFSRTLDEHDRNRAERGL